MDIQVSKLKLLKSNYTSQLYRLEDNIVKHYPKQIAAMKEAIVGYQEDVKTYVANKPSDKNQFSIKIGNKIYTDKKEAGVVLIDTCMEKKKPNLTVEIGEFRGFRMYFTYETIFSQFTITLKGKLSHDVGIGSDPLGNLQRLANTLDGLANKLVDLEQKLETVEHQLETAKIEVQKPFPQDAELKEKLERLSELNALLDMDEKTSDVIGVGDNELERNIHNSEGSPVYEDSVLLLDRASDYNIVKEEIAMARNVESDKGKVIRATEKQIEYATKIATSLKLDLPKENTKNAYKEFISTNQEKYVQSIKRPASYTDEQIERAHSVDILSYARSLGLELKRVGKDYEVLDYTGGLYISPQKNTWFWFSDNRGGDVIKFCMEIENKTWPEAVATLINEDMESHLHIRESKLIEPERKIFVLPKPNYTNKHVIEYLTRIRGLDEEIVKDMIDKHHIYENNMKSCVFVGRDKEGNAKHASVRSTNTSGKVFKLDAEGSDKDYTFSINGDSGVLNVFEAPIDLLSYMSLQKMHGIKTNDSYLALIGTSLKALERYMSDYGENIKKIRVCTDNDAYMNPHWNINENSMVSMKIAKDKIVRGQETENHILFRTYNDYSRYIEGNLEAPVYYICLPKEQLSVSEDGKIYSVQIEATKSYTLYETVQDYEKRKGFEISADNLYNYLFFRMPAGEKAAILIKEKYGDVCEVIREAPLQKDFNEELLENRKEEVFRSQVQLDDINREKLQVAIETTADYQEHAGRENIAEELEQAITNELEEGRVGQKVLPEHHQENEQLENILQMINNFSKLYSEANTLFSEDGFQQQVSEILTKYKRAIDSNPEGVITLLPTLFEEPNHNEIDIRGYSLWNGFWQALERYGITGDEKFSAEINSVATNPNTQEKALSIMKEIQRYLDDRLYVKSYMKDGNVINVDCESHYNNMVSDEVIDTVFGQNDVALRDLAVEESLINKLTNKPISSELHSIINRLDNGQYVPVEEIYNTSEIQLAESIISDATPSYQLEHREDLRLHVFEELEKIGSAVVDNDGNTIYNGDVTKEKRLDIVVGLPASGKSSAIAKTISQIYQSRLIDNDEAKKLIPEYNNGWGSSVVHKESKQISRRHLDYCRLRGDNIVLPKVGGDFGKMEKLINQFKASGYKVYYHYVDLSREKTLSRMLRRFIEDGRYLAPLLIDKYVNQEDGNKVSRVYEELKKGGMLDGYSKWSNDVRNGEQPRLIENECGGDFYDRIKEAYTGINSSDGGSRRYSGGFNQSEDRRDGISRMGQATFSGEYENSRPNISGSGENLSESEKEYLSFVDSHKQFIQDKSASVSRIPIVINAFGGPGSGKSVSCMDICQQLKKHGYNAEYVQEYAKDLVYDENWEMLDGSPENQFTVLKEQLRRIDRLYGTVDFIVTDSPVLLNSVYNKSLTKEYDNMVTSLYNDFENFTYFIERDASSYQQEGRIQNLEESQRIDADIKHLLADKEVYYGTYNHNTIDKIVTNSIRTFNRVNNVEEQATPKQLAYAEKIAKALNISLPEEKTKSALRTFISDHQESFSNISTPLVDDANMDKYAEYLELVSKNGSQLKDIPDTYYTSELLLAAVSNWGAAIQHIPENKITSEIALASVQQYGLNLKRVPEALKSEEICIAAYISSSGKSIRYTPSGLKERIKEEGLKRLTQDNQANPKWKRQLDIEQLQKQGQEWVSQIGNMLVEHEQSAEAMVEDIAFAGKFYDYSEKNIQLMLKQNPHITYVATASRFEKMGYHIKENEKAMIGRVPVFARYIVDDKGERIYSQDYTTEIKNQLNAGTLKEQQVLRNFKFVSAFYDISQTDCPIEDYPSVFHMGVPSELHHEAFEALKEFAEKTMGFKIMMTDFKSISMHGNSEPDNKIIRINDRMESTMALSTLCHEIAHCIIHTSNGDAGSSIAQKECEADVMAIMLESSLGLPISEDRRSHLYRCFHVYKEEQAAKEQPYEVTLEKLIDRVQAKVFRPYVDDINYYLSHHLPLEGKQNEILAEEVVKNIALLDSACGTSCKDTINRQNDLFENSRIDSYLELYHRTKEQYRLSNSFVPKLAVIKSLDGKYFYDLFSVQHLDEVTANLLQKNPEVITPDVLPCSTDVGNILALKMNVLENSNLYLVTPNGLQNVTDDLQTQFAEGLMENRINCGFDVTREYQCMHHLLENGIQLEPGLVRKYNYLCDALGFEKIKQQVPGNQLMARINLITQDLSQNNKELVMEYVFRTSNYVKAEEYAKKLEKEPGIVKSMFQELRLVDSYKYMLWTIAEYENSRSVSLETRITTGAYNSSAIPVLNDTVSTLEQINQSFLLIQKHASQESIKYYSIVPDENLFRIAYVELKDYQPIITYSASTFSDIGEAKYFYYEYLETPNTHLVDADVDLIYMEQQSNKIALSDVTTIGDTVASKKHGLETMDITKENALGLLRMDMAQSQGILQYQSNNSQDIDALKEFKKIVGRYDKERFIELCNLDNLSDREIMQEALDLAQELSEFKEYLESINEADIIDVKKCVEKAQDSSVTAIDIEKAFNAIDAAILSNEFSGLENMFEDYKEYNNVLETLKSSYVNSDRFCYVDYAATPGPYLYTNDLAGNIYKKSLRDEWNGSVLKLHMGLKDSGFEICTSFDDFRLYSANCRLSVGAPEKEKNEAFVRILQSTNDILPKDAVVNIYDFKNSMDKIYSGSEITNTDVTYKLTIRKDQEINSYIDTYSGDKELNVFEQLYEKAGVKNPELSKVIGKQYYQDQINFNEQHLLKPLMQQLKNEQKSLMESDELNAVMNSNDRLKEEIKKLDLSPADAEILKLNAGNIHTEQIASIQQQISMNQQSQQRRMQNQQPEGISLT